jgi:hypothetical protein
MRQRAIPVNHPPLPLPHPSGDVALAKRICGNERAFMLLS